MEAPCPIVNHIVEYARTIRNHEQARNGERVPAQEPSRLKAVVSRPQVGVAQRGVVLLPSEPVLRRAAAAAPDRPEYVVLVGGQCSPQANLRQW